MMNLDEAIQHCEEVAETNERICDTEPSIGLPDIYKHKDEAKKCASEHRQLAEWLKELKAYKDARVEINQALYDDARGEQNDYERGRKSGIFLCESIISVKLGESRSETPTSCGDAISRDELLKAMDTWDKFGYTETGCFVREPKNDCVKYIHYDDIIKCIKGMPSVMPQQRTGRWIPVGYDGYADGNPVYDWWECSECGWEHTGDEESLTAFCPNCGCKMEVEE